VGDDPDTVARRARDAVLAGYDATGGDAVTAALTHPDPLVRARAVGAAARTGRLGVDARVAALTDPDPIVRRRTCAIEARSPTRNARIATTLAGLLDDVDPLVVVGAATALGEAAAASGSEALEAVARGHRDARCREAAVAALGAIGAASSLEVVLEALHDKPAVRRRAVAALAAFDGPEVERALIVASEDRDWQVREIADALRSDPAG
jgi:HEAT repeat protein